MDNTPRVNHQARLPCCISLFLSASLHIPSTYLLSVTLSDYLSHPAALLTLSSSPSYSTFFLLTPSSSPSCSTLIFFTPSSSPPYSTFFLFTPSSSPSNSTLFLFTPSPLFLLNPLPTPSSSPSYSTLILPTHSSSPPYSTLFLLTHSSFSPSFTKRREIRHEKGASNRFTPPSQCFIIVQFLPPFTALGKSGSEGL